MWPRGAPDAVPDLEHWLLRHSTWRHWPRPSAPQGPNPWARQGPYRGAGSLHGLPPCASDRPVHDSSLAPSPAKRSAHAPPRHSAVCHRAVLATVHPYVNGRRACPSSHAGPHRATPAELGNVPLPARLCEWQRDDDRRLRAVGGPIVRMPHSGEARGGGLPHHHHKPRVSPNGAAEWGASPARRPSFSLCRLGAGAFCFLLAPYIWPALPPMSASQSTAVLG